MFNPMAFATPELQQRLAVMQQQTKNIKYRVHTDEETNRVEFTLYSDDPEAVKLIPQIGEGIVDSTSKMLYQMFAMEGERV